MKKETKKAPTIRFRGFTDDWEQRKVGDLTVELSEYLPLSSGYPLLTSSRNGLIYQNEYRNTKSTNNQSTLFSLVPVGSCTYRHMSDDDVFHLNINNLESGLVSREYPVFLASDNNDLNFLVQNINFNPNFRSFCSAQKKGGTRTRLYYKNLCKFRLMIPSASEQKRVSEFLATIDSLVALHQRKLDQLKKLKKYFLQNMFPAKGEKVPRIRFKGFTGDWEQRKLGDTCSEIGDGLHSTPQYDEKGPYYFINGNNLVAGKIVIDSGYILRVSERVFSQNDSHLNDKTILMSINGTIGNLAYYKGEPIMLGKSVTFLKCSDIDKKFLFCTLQTNYIFNQFRLSLTGTTIKNLGLKSIKNTILFLPNNTEQQRIGTCFENIDNLITFHQRKLNQLQTMKKFMLQNLFI